MSDIKKQDQGLPQEGDVADSQQEQVVAASEATAASQAADVNVGAGAEKSAAAVDDSAADVKPKCKKMTRSRLKATIAAAAAVVVVAGVGFAVWHEQPSFCNAICHTPMDAYYPTYAATPGEAAVDKWGNEVSDASSMLASVHNQAGKTCLDCHQPELSEQMSEGAEWVSGSYDATLSERTTTQLLEARGIDDSDEFCMNDNCHHFTREDLEKKTAWMGEINPHSSQHGEQKCSTCHKAHRQSVMYCSQCHTEAVIPDGWVSYTESKALEEASGTQE